MTLSDDDFFVLIFFCSFLVTHVAGANRNYVRSVRLCVRIFFLHETNWVCWLVNARVLARANNIDRKDYRFWLQEFIH